jgi:pyruvate-formate lyase
MQTSAREALISAGEYIAAGYSELPEGSPLARISRGLRRHFELSPLPDWDGQPLYPAGGVQPPGAPPVVRFHYTSGLVVDVPAIESKPWATSSQSVVLASVQEILRDRYINGSAITMEYGLGGMGFTHGIINYGRILRDGLCGYSRRISDIDDGADASSADFRSAMTDVVEGLQAFVQRCVELVRSKAETCPELATAGERLAGALQQAPLHPAKSFYQAMVATNLMWYVDGCDSLGRFDQDLGQYLDADLAAGRISRDEALELVRALWRSVNECNGWNVAIGGTDRQGRSACNALTEICLEAAVGSRRPNLALRVSRDMPYRVFDLALDSIASGCGLPALYNEEGYLEEVRTAFGCRDGDEHDFAFGGCTETMIHGCSNVGSIDGGISLLTVLDGSIRAHLPTAESFGQFFDLFMDDVRATVGRALDCVNRDQQFKAFAQPQPVRTLFTDDCLDRRVEYNAGGARYNGSVFNLGGLANVADSLAAIRDLVYGGAIGAGELIEALDCNFAGHEMLRASISRCPKFGNDDERVDELAARVASEAFGAVRSHTLWRGGRGFMPACIMFMVYGWAGEAVGATPDGRPAREPVADSVGPVQGRDASGPTAMLSSVAKLPLSQAIGTPVLNIRLARAIFSTPEGRERVKALIRGFFSLGGMQVQVSVVDSAVLLDAMDHPERHNDLIVRIGGFSEYFNSLSPDLKLSVLQRTEHCGR